MKIYKYAMLLISVALFTACAQEFVEQPINEKSKSIIKADIDDSQTKASITSRGEFYWNSSDKIDVYTDSERFLEFSIESGAGTKSAKFSGNLDETEEVSNIAVYPIGLSPVISDEGVIITLPSEYELEDDNLVCKTPMVAEIDGNGKAVFKHVAGLMRFTFRGIPEEAIKLCISADAKISGEFTVSNGVISTQNTNSAEGIVVNLGKFYNTRDLVINLPIPTGHYTEINISFLDEAGNIVYEKNSTKARTVAVGEMHVFKPIVIAHPYVDLGLPSGTLWAEYNVGASSPEEYGDYFSFGETSPKDWYSEDTYSFDKSLSKGENLALVDDAAYVNWGENWRMPTKDDWQELIDNCSYTESAFNAVEGMMFTGPNGNTIFLPYAGMYYLNNEEWCIGSGAQYLSSTAYDCLQILSGSVEFKTYTYLQYYGRPLRAVKKIASDEVYLTSSLSLEVGESSKLTLNNASESIVWSSSDESIATVSHEGIVTAVAEGKAEIRATVGSVTRSCEVSVVQRPDIEVSVIDKSDAVIVNGYILRHSAVTWKLQNKSEVAANLVSAQIVNYNTSDYGNVMPLDVTIFAGESLGYTITFGKDMPISSVLVFTIEYKGHLFEYVGGID